ncbi:hypothetical protein CBR_g48139 [Chara braunii]|uniref:Uncharacterized protein n=1 Tax=Chara braunii TaxID=69332 RepID=A0A388M2A1_CHABU|nr:hypothetical protein CBR_g48139 [Chara braunii]|eukprot:GBG88609.1 hypothetical protein CBR_g48139 [Chara braunii]
MPLAPHFHLRRLQQNAQLSNMRESWWNGGQVCQRMACIGNLSGCLNRLHGERVVCQCRSLRAQCAAQQETMVSCFRERMVYFGDVIG